MSRWRHRLVPVAIALLAVLAVASIAVALVQRDDAGDAQREAARLGRELAAARRRIAELEDRLERSDPMGDVLEGLTDALGDSGGSGDLFGGDAGMDLLGNPDILECIGGGDLFGGDLDDLLSGKGAGDLDDLLSGKGAGDLDDLPSGDGSSLGGLLGGAARPTPRDPKAAIESISKRVERMRRLRFEEPVEPEFLSARAANRRLLELFAEDYSRRDGVIEGRILEALGAIPSGSDLFEMRKDALSAGVAGFYVPGTGELVVKSPEGGLGPIEEVTLSHELEHALADQALELGSALNENPSPRELDSALAGLALVEGDATLLMQRYSLVALDFGEQLALAGDPSVLEAQEALEASPPYIQSELLFPYTTGLEFVCDLYLDGGWRSVDRAYERPPTTTAQVLLPELYRRRRGPAAPANPGSLPDPWERAHAGSFGAAPLLWHLEAPGGDESAAVENAETAATSWGGGKLHLWVDGNDSAVGIALTARTQPSVLCDAVVDWLASADPGARATDPGAGEALAIDGDERDAVVACSGPDIRAGVAPSLAVARALTRS